MLGLAGGGGAYWYKKRRLAKETDPEFMQFDDEKRVPDPDQTQAEKDAAI